MALCFLQDNLVSLQTVKPKIGILLLISTVKNYMSMKLTPTSFHFIYNYTTYSNKKKKTRSNISGWLTTDRNSMGPKQALVQQHVNIPVSVYYMSICECNK